MRVLRATGLLTVGAWAGFMGAAAVLKRALPSQGDEESDELALVAVFDGIDLKSRSQAFRGGSLLAWYGGIAVDLREAVLAPDASLRVHSLFGGIAVRVPPEWRIESSANALVGGVEVKGAGDDDPAAPTLRLEGWALFGGIAVGAKVREGAPES
jgi:hypothetical protein